MTDKQLALVDGELEKFIHRLAFHGVATYDEIFAAMPSHLCHEMRQSYFKLAEKK